MIAVILSVLLAVLLLAALQIRETVVHTGVKIAVEPVVANGSLIKMQISADRANQTISQVTYELADDDNINVHVAMDFLERNQAQKEETLQLLIHTETKVHFIVNDQMLDTYLIKDGAIWKKIG